MKNLLIVDDESDNLDVLRDILSEQSYRLFEAQDGEQAWSVLTESGTDFDCIVLDRMMPRLDGMGLARRMMASERFVHLPIVMQTAAAEPEQVAEGLALGVFCYLTKPCEPTILRAAVRAALEQHENWRSIARELTQQRTFSHLLTKANFEIKHYHQACSLAAGIGVTAANPDAVSLGLNELLNNAIEHGNLDLTYQDKSHLLVTNGWHDEVLRRHALPEYSSRRVRVQFERRGALARVLIEDEGKGFDWQRYIKVDPERAYDLHGRGIALARQIAFNNIGYMGVGNQVQVEFDLAPTP